MGGERITPVILCGGAGTRLWPASRDELPKPFLPLVDGVSTFAGTIARVADPALFAPPIVIGNRGHGRLIAAALGEAGSDGAVLLEPLARDTAPAIAAAAAYAAREAPDGLLLVLAADHLIRDVAGFRATVARAAPAARVGRIVVFGIPPAAPVTGYGYIRPGAPLAGFDGVAEVAAFVEKPDAATAARYVAEGYFWNSGNFMLSAATALAEIDAFAPAIAAAARAAVEDAEAAGDGLLLAADAFARAPKVSIDYAVMEKTKRAAVVAARYDWSDLGAWSAIFEASAKDGAGNAAGGRTLLLDTRASYVASDGPLVATLGITDMAVVAANGAVLVAPLARASEVKRVAEAAAGHGRAVRAEWGSHETLLAEPGQRITRIAVAPKAHAAWRAASHAGLTVVAGTGTIAIGGAARPCEPGGVVAIAPEEFLTVENSGEGPLVLIAAATGPLGL
jgi:mannose-1-phosphate guanylyltransferase/mannose-6-phosphate isomerase